MLFCYLLIMWYLLALIRGCLISIFVPPPRHIFDHPLLEIVMVPKPWADNPYLRQQLLGCSWRQVHWVLSTSSLRISTTSLFFSTWMATDVIQFYLEKLYFYTSLLKEIGSTTYNSSLPYLYITLDYFCVESTHNSTLFGSGGSWFRCKQQ